jgi:hypothetical protein
MRLLRQRMMDSSCSFKVVVLTSTVAHRGAVGRGGVHTIILHALFAALGLPDMQPLRQLLAREPGLTGKGISPNPVKASLTWTNRRPPTSRRNFACSDYRRHTFPQPERQSRH